MLEIPGLCYSIIVYNAKTLQKSSFKTLHLVKSRINVNMTFENGAGFYLEKMKNIILTR